MKVLMVYDIGGPFENERIIIEFDEVSEMLEFVNKNIHREGFKPIKIVQFFNEIELEPVNIITEMAIKPKK